MGPDQCTSKRVGPFQPHSGSGAGLGEKRRYLAAEDGELEKSQLVRNVTHMWVLPLSLPYHSSGVRKMLPFVTPFQMPLIQNYEYVKRCPSIGGSPLALKD